MTEKEKMLNQMIYDANYDKELIAERQKAKSLCYEFNHLHPAKEDEQRDIMKRLLGHTKGSFNIIAPFLCDYGYNIEIGENFFANHNTVILDCAKVTFGDNVFIAPNCGFYTAGHPLDIKRRNQGLEYAVRPMILMGTATGSQIIYFFPELIIHNIDLPDYAIIISVIQ